MQFSNYQRALLLATSAIVLAVIGCGGGGGGGGSDPKPEPINHPPSASIVQPTERPITLDVRSAQTVDLTVKAEDPDGNKLHCIWTWDGGSVAPSEQDSEAGYQVTARFTPPNYDGPCHVKCTVSDGQYSAEANFTVEVSGNNVQPSSQLRITGITVNPDPASPSQTANLTAVVQNPEGKTLTYTWAAKAGHISGSGASVTWDTPNVPGIYGLYVTVSDGTNIVASGKAVTVAGPSGGLLGEYFKTKREKNIVYLDNLVMTRVDPMVNLVWENLSPDPEHLGNEGWGARWTGFIKCEQPGTYVFRVHVDDGARMKIQNDNGEWVDVIPNCDADWTDHNKGAWLPAETVPLDLQGGKWYPVQLEFFQGAENAFVELYWSINGGEETLIEQEYLKPPGS
jgi:hypothetical protein